MSITNNGVNNPFERELSNVIANPATQVKAKGHNWEVLTEAQQYSFAIIASSLLAAIFVTSMSMALNPKMSFTLILPKCIPAINGSFFVIGAAGLGISTLAKYLIQKAKNSELLDDL